MHLYFPRGRGVSKANLNWTELQSELEFPEVKGFGDRVKGEDSKKSVNIFWNNTILVWLYES